MKEGGQCLPAPARAGPRASLSVPASPRGGREHLASGLPIGRAGARAVDRHDVRVVLQDQAGDLVATQMVTQVENPLIIDDRDVEALAFAAYIDTDPPRHKPSMP
jgi:hypothetical protein